MPEIRDSSKSSKPPNPTEGLSNYDMAALDRMNSYVRQVITENKENISGINVDRITLRKILEEVCEANGAASVYCKKIEETLNDIQALFLGSQLAFLNVMEECEKNDITQFLDIEWSETVLLKLLKTKYFKSVIQIVFDGDENIINSIINNHVETHYGPPVSDSNSALRRVLQKLENRSRDDRSEMTRILANHNRGLEDKFMRLLRSNEDTAKTYETAMKKMAKTNDLPIESK